MITMNSSLTFLAQLPIGLVFFGAYYTIVKWFEVRIYLNCLDDESFIPSNAVLSPLWMGWAFGELFPFLESLFDQDSQAAHKKKCISQQCNDLINWESIYNPKRLILERSKTTKKHQKLFFTLCLWARGWYLGQGNKEQAYFIWSAKAAPLIIKELEVLETFYARTSNLSSEFEPKANLQKAVRAPITDIW